MSKKIDYDFIGVSKASIPRPNMKKVVKGKTGTRSGIGSYRSDERTLRLYEATAIRSGKLNRLMNEAGISSSKHLASITGMPPGAMGRIIRGDSCLSTSGCFQIQYSLWNNRATGGIPEGGENMTKNNSKKIYTRAGHMINAHDNEITVVNSNNNVNISDMLSDMLSTYNGFVGSSLVGLIPKNNNTEEVLDKTMLAIFGILDLFLLINSNSFIAFPDDNTIMGCVEVQPKDISCLNGKICVIQTNPESSMAARKVIIQNDFIIFKNLDGTDLGMFVLKKDSPVHKIGQVFLNLTGIHKKIIETAMTMDMNNINTDKTPHQSKNENNNIFVINSSSGNENDKSYDDIL